MAELWLVKDKKGRIFGPYSEEEICFHIQEGEFKGEELLSSYPAGKWKPISAHSVFYEKILEKLYKKSSSSRSKKTKTKEESSLDPSSDMSSEEPIEPTRIVAPRETKSSKIKEKHKIKLSKEFKEDVLFEEGMEEDVIEMEDVKGQLFDKLKTALKIPVLVFAGLLAVFFLFFNQSPDSTKEERVRILSVSKKREPLPKEELKKKLQLAKKFYFRGNVSDYLKAQSLYVEILETNSKLAEIYPHLCLVYLEIWPFAYQDTQDKSAIKQTLNLVSKKDTGGIYSGLCKSVQALIDKNPEKSLMITESSLNVLQKTFPYFFYYLKAKALKALKKNSEAKNYLTNLYKLKPKWLAPYMLSAEMSYERKEYDLAIKLYQKVLSLFPKHTSANLMMGILEYKHFKKIEKSEKRLKSVLLDLNDLVVPHILIEAYVTLAEIYLKRNDKNEVSKYSNKAYALDPEHPDVMRLKFKLGKAGNFEDTKVKVWGLIYRGDILVAQGNCVEAQKYFSKAYNAGEQRLALAALRMAQCRWQAGASGQAIRWLRRAINADSQMLEAYFLLSDYLSKLYDFESAKEILEASRSQNPSNYDLFKAYALLSFRQKNYQAAIAYAKRSLNFYTSDIEIYILLSKAHRALGQVHRAVSYAERAIAEDGNNIQAQITYAYALDIAYGFHKAKEYFEKLIHHFPLIIDYSQALGEYYFERNMYEEAREEFENIIQKNPKFKPAYVYLGRIYSYLSYKEGGRGEKYEQALKYFLEASLLDISDPDPLFYTGQAHLEHKQYQQAENEFEKILQINPNYPFIHYYIGFVNFHQGGEENLAKALKFARTQSAKTPTHFYPYKLAGNIYKLKAQGVFKDPQDKRVTYELCAKEYQKALKYIKNDIEISIGLIECHKGSGNVEAALQLAKDLTKQKGLSGYPILYREIGSLYEFKDQYEKARGYYMSYFRLDPGAKDRKEIESRINQLINEKKELSGSSEGNDEKSK